MINRECGVFRTTYQADMALYQVPLARLTVLAFAVLFVLVLPLVLESTYLVWLNVVGLNIIAALGLNLLTGFCGQISVGHAAFMAVGAYTAAILVARAGMPFWVGMISGGALAAVYGLIVGLPSLRVKGFYLAIATLAAQFITEWTINHVKWISGGGFQAAILVPPPRLGPLVLDTEVEKYYLILATTIVALAVALNIARSRIGRAFVAIRDRDVAAEIIGVDIYRYKILAFLISSFYAGVAGALWVYYLGVANIESFRLVESIALLAMIIIGGLGSILGTIFGATFVTLLPFALEEVLHALKGVLPVADIHTFVAHLRLAVFGGLIVLFLVVEPEGLNRLWRNIKDYFRVWPFSY
jgi:branched-chain amino acid transport system permease protein